jgi:hypothetical protein
MMLGYLLARAGVAVTVLEKHNDFFRDFRGDTVSRNECRGAHRGFDYIFRHPGSLKAPWQLKLATRVPGIQSLLGRMIGAGVRPEHIHQRNIR